MAEPEAVPAADAAVEDYVDPELAEAEAEVAAELADPEPAPPAEAPAEPLVVMIPKERLDQVLRRLDDERSRRLVLEGENAALKTVRPEPPAAAQAADPAIERLHQIDAELDRLYDQFDLGELPLRDLRLAERRLHREAGDLQRARGDDPGPSAPVGSDAYVADQTRLLEMGNPWLANIPGALLHDFLPMAARLCAAAGIRIRDGDPAADLGLRRALVTVLKEHGYDRRYGAPGAADPTRPGGPGGDAPPSGTRIATNGLSPRQIRDKMALADRAVPSPTRGGGVPRDLHITASDIERMSEDEILSLPPDIQERIAASQA